MRPLLLSAALLALLPAAAWAEKRTVTLTLDAGKHDRHYEPVCVPLELPKGFAPGFQVTLKNDKGESECVGQVTARGLIHPAREGTDGSVPCELHFVLSKLKAGQKLTLTAEFDSARMTRPEGGYVWKDTAGEFCELSWDKTPVLRYMYRALDDSTDAKREETFKVYHHVYAQGGKRLVTKGVGGLYTHHRGLFYGFLKVTYEGKDGVHTVDNWHGKDNVKGKKDETHQAHEKFLSQEAGAVLARQRLAIGWHGVGKELFAHEERELTVYNVSPNGTLIEFVSKVAPVRGTLKVDGDPQHAGFHFRADNEVNEKGKDQTIFIRPDGPGKAGTEKNWPKDKEMVDLPWNAMSFVLGGQRYTAAYLDHPANPKEARYSERTYGRFGSYFVAEATEKKPLLVRYRVWLQEGQMKGEQVAALAAQFVEPVQVTVK
jgi:hypothetical protein